MRIGIALLLAAASPLRAQWGVRADADSAAMAEIEVLEVRVYGDTAILTFVLTIGRDGETVRRSRLVKVFVRRDGRWMMVHNQGTAIE